MCEVMPTLVKSAQAIYAHRPRCMNKKSEAMMNFKLSVRGSIRQAPSCITWLLMLVNLKAHGVTDASTVIKEWNDSNPRSSALTGGKAQAVKLLLDKAPLAAVDYLTEHVGIFGWVHCAFSDDALASKKLYPGQVFKHARSGWTERCTVTEKSCELTLKFLANEWKSRPDTVRRKPTKKDAEEAAELVSMVYSIYVDVCKTTNLKHTDVDRVFLDEFVSTTNTELNMEIASIMQEKPEKIMLERISCLKALAARQNAASPTKTSTLMLTQNLENNTFEQVKSQMEHDVTVVQIYDKKFRDHEKAPYWKKITWTNTQNNNIVDAVSNIFDASCVLTVFDKVEEMHKSYLDCKNAMMKNQMLDLEDKQIVPWPGIGGVQ